MKTLLNLAILVYYAILKPIFEQIVETLLNSALLVYYAILKPIFELIVETLRSIARILTFTCIGLLAYLYGELLGNHMAMKAGLSVSLVETEFQESHINRLRARTSHLNIRLQKLEAKLKIIEKKRKEEKQKSEKIQGNRVITMDNHKGE